MTKQEAVFGLPVWFGELPSQIISGVFETEYGECVRIAYCDNPVPISDLKELRF